MSREPSPKRFEALRIWLKSGKEKKLKDIAEELGVKDSQVRKWKCVDKWDEIPDTGPRRGAPYRNKNAVGNKGGAPKDNQNAYKHGMFSKWLPDDEETQQIYEAARDGLSMLDLLYEEILISFTNFIRAQKIMFVKDHDDMTKELKKEKVRKELVEMTEPDGSKRIENVETEVDREYDIQYGWDKQAKVLTAQAAASRSLSSKIKQYEELVRTLPPEEVKDEHRLKISKLKADVEAAKTKGW